MSKSAGRSRVTEINREQLYHLVWSKPLGSVAPQFGLTANGLAKMCDRLAIPRPTRNFWTRNPEERPPRTPLPLAPEGVGDRVVVGGARSSGRRPRTRLSLLDRQQQLMDEASRIALECGVQAVTLRRIARETGISETQAHNCFPGRLDLLTALARREIAITEAKRRGRVARGNDRMSRVVISTITYLHEAAERGPLLQLLLRNGEVRQALRAERVEAVTEGRAPILDALAGGQRMDRTIANGSTAALTALCLRAGGLIASGRKDFALVERICLSLVMAGTRSNHELADI